VGAEQIFNVLTEFRFDIAHAVAGSKELQSTIGDISNAAQQAEYNIKRISMGLVAHAGLGTGGFIGVLYSVINAADKFEQSQRAIANIMMTNNLFTGADAYAKSMNEAGLAMEHINDVANKFSLPADELLNFSKMIGATLVNSGLDNSRLDKSINLSRGFLKSAPVLGIHPQLAQGQLMDAIGSHSGGGANMGDTLFRRLTGETEAMKAYSGSAGAKAFNALPQAQRLDVLTKALSQFGSVTEIVTANANSLHSQLERLKGNIIGVFTVLRPIGKAIMDPFRKILLQVNTYLEHEGKKIGQTLGRVLTDILKSPEKLFAQIQQLRGLKQDVKSAGNILALVGLLHGITSALKFMGVTLNGGLLMTGLRAIGSAFSYLFGIIPGMAILSFIFRAFSFLITSVVAPLVLLTTILQGITRGMAQAKIADMKWIAGNMPKFLLFFENMKIQFEAIMSPITLAIEGIAMFVEWLFSFGEGSQFIVDHLNVISTAFELLGRTIVGILSIVSGVTNAIIGLIFDLKAMNFKGALTNLGPNFMEGMTDLYHRFYKPKSMDINDQSTAQTKVEIDKIEINNAFKENAEPDRIAFTMRDQMLKAALNPLQAQGRSLRGLSNGF